MKIISHVMLASIILLMSFSASLAAENGVVEKKQGAYTIIEGRVFSITARSLELDGKQYPISPFVRVYNNDTEKGAEIPMRTIANTGKIDKARIYLIGGKVEKIIVLLNI